MKTYLLIIILGSSFFVKAQNDSIYKNINRQREIQNCEVISLNSVDIIAKKLITNNYKAVGEILDEWTKSCGYSEVSKRIAIIKAIATQEKTENLISDYIYYKFEYKYKNRINVSKKENFGYIYMYDKYYFDYVPLRHPIDSLLRAKSSSLLLSGSLSYDEKLICTLFSENIDEYEMQLDNNNDTSIIKQERENVCQNFRKYNFGINVFLGSYNPMGKSNVFGNNFMFGFGVSTPLDGKLLIELAARMRINANDKNFNYHAFDEINSVNSKTSIYAGAFIGYKLFDNEKYLVYSKIGAGLETVDTGLKQKYEHKDDVLYDVETIHLSASVSIMKPIFKVNYIGFELGYHYVPYHLVENLKTEFNTSSISAELFFRL